MGMNDWPSRRAINTSRERTQAKPELLFSKPQRKVDATPGVPNDRLFVVGVGASGSGGLEQDSRGAPALVLP
jgi:hypothetical protein